MRGSSKRVAKRAFRAPLIGDPGIIPERRPTPVIPADVDLDSMSFSDLFQLALRIGVNASDVCGVSQCSEHRDMLQVQRPPTAKFTLGMDVLYCKACFTWFREKKPLPSI